MISTKLILNKNRNVSLDFYLWRNSPELKGDIKRPMVIICPGGGYSMLSDREGEPIAIKYLAAGYDAAVLKYGIKEYAVAPGPTTDLADAVYYVKKHADELGINKDQIFVCGFSAGAHVAASLGVFWDNEEVLPKYKDEKEMIRPAGTILGYPVLDLASTTEHLDLGIQPGTKMEDIYFDQIHPNLPLEKHYVFDENRYFIDFRTSMNAFIFGGEYTPEMEEFYSLQNQVKETTPPAFIWHTAEDGLIFPANSYKFAAALADKGVRYELHIFSEGNHGLALGDYVTGTYRNQVVPAVSGWMDLSIKWVNRITGFPELFVD